MVDTTVVNKKWDHVFRELSKDARKCLKCKKIFDPEKNFGSWQCVQLFEFVKDNEEYTGMIRADHSDTKESFTDADDVVIAKEFVRHNYFRYFTTTINFYSPDEYEQDNGFAFYQNVVIKRYDHQTLESVIDQMPYLTSDVEVLVGKRFQAYGRKLPLYIDAT
jgi:hypothetical protein